MTEREELKELYLTSLAKVADLHELQGDHQSATFYCKRILAIDGSREDIHRQLISLYSKTGDRVSAIRQYRQCARILREELGVNPSAGTRSALKDFISAATSPPDKGA